MTTHVSPNTMTALTLARRCFSLDKFRSSRLAEEWGKAGSKCKRNHKSSVQAIHTEIADHSLRSTVSEIMTSGKMCSCGTWNNVYKCSSKVWSALSLIRWMLALIHILLVNPITFWFPPVIPGGLYCRSDWKGCEKEWKSMQCQFWQQQ